MCVSDFLEWDVTDDAFVVTSKDNGQTFTFRIKADSMYNLPSLLHVRHVIEFFWNQHLQHNNIPSLKHTTHGRCVAKVFTLQGHQDPKPVPLGELDVKDNEGKIVAGFSNERNRRASR